MPLYKNFSNFGLMVDNNAGDNAAVSSHAGAAGEIHVIPKQGYTDGVDDASIITDADFTAGNIKLGVNIFGIDGSYDAGGSILTGDAIAGEVLDGKFFYSDDPATKIEGTMPNNADANVEVTDVDGTTIPAGYYNGSGIAVLSATEAAKVVTGNIKSGITLLGVAGNANVVDTSSGDAVAGDIAKGKKAWVDGAEVTGTHIEIPAGAVLWFDASKITGLNDGDAVGTWNDSSGNGYDATQATADNKPIYKTNIINGYPVVRFDGSNDVLTISGSASVAALKLLHSATSSALFAVCKIGTSESPEAFYGLIGNNADASTAIGFDVAYNDASTAENTIRDKVTYGTSGQAVYSNISANNAFSPNTFHLLWMLRDPDNATASLRSKMYVDMIGGTPTTANPSTGVASTNDATYDIDVGAIGNSQYPMAGDIAEIIIYNSELTAPKIAAVYGYLANKYALGSY